jgi:hypothetical protein
VILPLGVFFTYKATVDAQLFNKEAWMKAFSAVVNFFRRGKRKEGGGKRIIENQ